MPALEINITEFYAVVCVAGAFVVARFKGVAVVGSEMSRMGWMSGGEYFCIMDFSEELILGDVVFGLSVFKVLRRCTKCFRNTVFHD